MAKVGQVRVRRSRELPSVPSSVTVIREPDGRFYASFVVGRDPTPLPPVARTAGIDLGLASFAVVAGSDGTTDGLRPCTGRSATGGPIITTSSPCG